MHMYRVLNTVSYVILLSLALAGCGDSALLRNGPNPVLLAPDTSERVDFQNTYFRLICAGANITDHTCSDQAEDEWKRVVYFALNDIDDRCEIYVASLAQAKREGDAYLSQLSLISATTGTILGQTLDKSAKSGARAIAIVQAAFGLGEQAMSGYYSRLLLAIEPGTVQQIVLKRQTAFRKALRYGIEIKGQLRRMPLRSRADAYYVIRTYLRICLPDSLEASIDEGIEDMVFLLKNERTVAVSGNQYISAVDPAIGRPLGQSAPRRIDPDVNALTARTR